MDLLTTQKKIEELAGRPVEIAEINFKGQQGYLPEYINYNFQSRVSEIFDTSKEECAKKFLTFLQSVEKTGDQDGTDPGSKPTDNQEDSEDSSDQW